MESTRSIPLIREFTAESGHKVRLGLDSQVLRLKNERLDETDDMTLSRSLSELVRVDRDGEESYVPAGTLIYKARQFDDGFMATIEKYLQEGLGDFPGKRKLLESLGQSLIKVGKSPSEDSFARAAVIIFAALELSGARAAGLSKDWQEKVDERLKQFEAQPVISKPIAYYTWNDELGAVFRQDRMLQTPLEMSKDAAGANTLAGIIKEDGELLDSYLKLLDMVHKLTNSPRLPDLRVLFTSGGGDFETEVLATIPPTVSHEEDLLAKLIGPGNPVPKNFSLMDEFIKVVRSRKMSLRPTADSGWYDYVTWSLAPLIAPHLMVESEHLSVDDSYFELLEDLLRGTIALARVAHPRSLPEKELAPSETSPSSQLKIKPRITVEPLPTFYYRRAYSYRFLKSVVSGIFGEKELRKMHRLTRDGKAGEDLYTELAFMEDLFNGAHISSCQDLGMKPAQTPESSLEVFQGWAGSFAEDPDLAGDQRTMVPIHYDLESGLVRVWCFMGWRREELNVAFEKPPEVEVFDRSGKKLARKDLWLRPHNSGEGEGKDEISYSFESAAFAGYYPVMEEIMVKDVLDRKAFQKVCDEKSSLKEIIDALSAQ
ncbi:MAG: hypothetical protein AB7W16_26575 [Candidatus Obscuribacterales bacterium]